MTQKSNRNRKFSSTQTAGGSVTLTEATAYIPYGYQRRKWSHKSVSLTLDELRGLAKKYLETTAEAKS